MLVRSVRLAERIIYFFFFFTNERPATIETMDVERFDFPLEPRVFVGTEYLSRTRADRRTVRKEAGVAGDAEWEKLVKVNESHCAERIKKERKKETREERRPAIAKSFDCKDDKMKLCWFI